MRAELYGSRQLRVVKIQSFLTSNYERLDYQRVELVATAKISRLTTDNELKKIVRDKWRVTGYKKH